MRGWDPAAAPVPMLLPLDDVLSIKRGIGRVTLNDIAMACVSGALREYLGHHRALPKKSLAEWGPDQPAQAGRGRGGWQQDSDHGGRPGYHVADPVQRLRLIGPLRGGG